MKHQYLAPPGSLKDHVHYFWILESDDPVTINRTFKIVVDGCPGIVFLDNASAFQGYKNTSSPGIFLYGQTTRHITNLSKGSFTTLGAYFYPDALKTIFGIDANELKNMHVDLDEIGKEKRLATRLSSASSTQERIELLSAFLNTCINNNKRSQNPGVQYALKRICDEQGMVSLKDLERDLKISKRTLERIFQQSIGISPKLYARIIRFQYALGHMRCDRYTKLSDVAFDCQYSDQSHFIRQFKEFSGLSPLEFKKQTKEKIKNFPEWAP